MFHRDAIYSRDRDISSNADWTRFGGSDSRSDDFAGRVEISFTSHSLIAVHFILRARLSKRRKRSAIRAAVSLPRGQQLFNFAALTPAIPAADREYLYGSLDRKIYDQYLELFADFKYVRTFWDGALGASLVYA